MFNVVITNIVTGEITVERVADNFVLLSQQGNTFSKSGYPDDLILQLGMLHFAINQVKTEMTKPTRVAFGGGKE